MNKDKKDENQLFLKGKIDSFDVNTANITLEDGQKLSWPKDKLPPKVKAGLDIYLKVSDEKSQITEEENISKSMLNKLLGDK